VDKLSHDPLASRYEAIVFDWDGTAVPDRAADASEVRDVVEALCRQCVDVVVVSGTHVGNIDGQLRARPRGPGRLLLALNRGPSCSRSAPTDPRSSIDVSRRRPKTPRSPPRHNSRLSGSARAA